ncbi:hypothetical protein FQA39_LY08842 [Lamprigera yunnana]|nr:hypothetical protein FQA39_LY08842 [Lamprigera yunnana]
MADENYANNDPIDLDDILPQVGEFGKYQKIMLWLVCLPACIPCGFCAFNQLFMANVPDHWCAVTELSNFTQTERKRLSIPTRNVTFEKCKRYSVDWKELLNDVNITDIEPSSTWPVEGCLEGWEYNKSEITSSIFDLVCEKEIYPTIGLTALNVSGPIGVYFFGYLNDKIGRKKSFFICLFTLLLGSVLTAISSGYWYWAASRLIVGLTLPAIYQIPFILALELVGANYRSFVTVLTCSFYTFGLMGLAGVAYLVRDWVHLTLITSLPFFLYSAYWFFLPESPRWLLANGKFEEALSLLENLAKTNNCELPPNFKHRLKCRMMLTRKKSLDDTKKKCIDMCILCRTPNMRLKTILITIIWFANSSVYIGLNYYGPALGDNEYLSFFLSSVVEIPSYLLCWLVLDCWGRRWPLCLSMILSGCSCIATVLLPENSPTSTLVLYLISKFAISAAFLIMYPLAGELYPTELRGIGIGTSSYIGGLGLIIIPFITHLGSENLILPLIIMGVIAMVGGILGLRLPETLHYRLPQTVEEGEEFGKYFTLEDCYRCIPLRTEPENDSYEDLELRTTNEMSEETPLEVPKKLSMHRLARQSSFMDTQKDSDGSLKITYCYHLLRGANMNPDDDEAAINQLKHPRLSFEVLPRVELDFIRALQYFQTGKVAKYSFSLRAFAEDEFVRKEYREMRCEMPGAPRSTFLMVFSPDGSKVASTHGNHNIYVTDLRTGKNIKTLVGHPRTPWCIAFHPTCNELVASGCLGGQVRIWDLSGGSEVWTAGNQTVIASIAFHPNDRVLVIATYNELYFWDWSKPQPFTQTTTCNTKEKVRFVAFDKLGHKLITGIANTPQYRWERSRAAASQNRTDSRTRTSTSPAEISTTSYRRRSVPRSLEPYACPSTSQVTTPTTTTTDRVPLSSVPERERRITACYRNLVHEYELLVHRYLQVYRPPITIDRGTDPMEMDSVNDAQEPGPSTRRTTPCTSQTISPPITSAETIINEPSTSRCRLVLRTTLGIQTSTDSTRKSKPQENSSFQMKIKCSPKRILKNNVRSDLNKLQHTLANIEKEFIKSSNLEEPTASTSTDGTNLPSTSNEGLNNNDREPWRMHLKRLHPGFIKKTSKQNRKPILDTSSDSSSDDENILKKRSYAYSNAAYNASTSNTNSNSAQADNLFSNSQPSTSSCPDRSESICNGNSSLCQSTKVDRPVCLSKFIANAGNTTEQSSNDNLCDRCGENVESRSDLECKVTSADAVTSTPSAPVVSESLPCARTLMNTDTCTTNSTVYTPSSGSRRRFFSHLLSAFIPTRVNTFSQSRQRQNRGLVTPNRIETIARSNTFPPDEVINYSERVNSEDEVAEQPANLNDFHPFDPPPEFPSINPENFGIGNMYSNIVQDLESSLNNVRNIRASNRPGETSDMLSSFSERLESIMHQSDSILRNLRNSVDMLPQNSEGELRRSQRIASRSLLSTPDHPRFLFNDPSFYIRDQNQTSSEGNSNRTEAVESFSNTSQHEELFNNRSAIASDHTYPRNPESPRTLAPTTDNLTPLMTSLHLTISHIQRQARLLRLQVESIERIDRAMLEVAQIQNIRQMYGELRRILTNLIDNRNTGVSSVRQMMAGTRISDSSPGNSSVEEDLSSNRPTTESNSSIFQDAPSTSLNENGSTRQRVSARKSFPPSRLLHVQRQTRRFAVVNFLPRRYTARDRAIRRRVYFRALSNRRIPLRLGTEFYERTFQENRVSYDSLVQIQRKLEFLLTEYIRRIGEPEQNQRVEDVEDSEENIVKVLGLCRWRLDRLSGQRREDPNTRIETSSVTEDGVSRTLARGTLTCMLDSILRFLDDNPNSSITQNVRSQIRNSIDLTSLFCDILLLHIVDSIPPPTGMNLDPERESLSARIDQMCSRMLQSRLSGHSQGFTRSLHLMRLTARYASRALGHTYHARRNAMFSNGNTSRRELIGQINNTLHSINRNRRVLQSDDAHSSTDAPSDMPMRGWYQTLNSLALQSNSGTAGTTSVSSNSPPRPSTHTSDLLDRPRSANFLTEEGSVSDDDNDSWYNTNRRQTLYRTNNVNLLSNDSTSYQQNRLWNLPTVQINDVPISDSGTAWHSRISHSSYRLSELRSNPTGSLFRPRFLHPSYAGVNPFDTDIDEPQREQSYDGDMILTVTPNHRIQAWDISSGNIPDISNSMKNIVVGECKIHNDASVDISADGTILVTLLPSGGYLNVTNRLGVYSLRWESLGQCLYITSFEQNAVSVSLSPLSRHLVVGLASRRVSIVPNDKWTMARIFLLSEKDMPYGSRLPVLRELEQNRDTNYMSLNCIRWLPFSGQGLIYATNTGQLRVLT